MGAQTTHTRGRRDDRGAVLVEYAFTFPLLLLVTVFGMSFLWTAFVHVSAGHAAREGARYASVALPPTYREHPDVDAIVARVRHRVPVLRLEASDVAVTYPGCSDCTTASANAPVVVAVTKDLPDPVAVFSRILGGTGRIVTSSKGEVRAE